MGSERRNPSVGYLFSCLRKMKEIELFEMVNYDIEIQMMDITNCFRNTGKKDDAHEHL